ncbi:hypothetical protein JCM1841_001406 [Sporobolomyces salmonicolor]
MPPADLYPRFNDNGPKPQHFRGLTLGRLDQFDGKIAQVLYEHRIDDQEHISFEVWSSPGREKTPFAEAVRKPFKPAEKGLELGPSWTNHWFRITINLPVSWSHAERVQLEWDPSCEACVFDTEGCPLQGITGGYGIDRRVEFILPKEKRGSTYRYYIEVSCNGMFGNGMGETNGPPDQNRYFRLESADLVVPRMEAWHLLWDFRCIKDLARQLPERSPLGNKCLEVANAIMNTFSPTDLSSIPAARKIAQEVLGKEWEELGAAIYKKDTKGVDSFAIGNCHIDTAWLWTFSQTRQKSARSWSTQLDLMNRYPEHRFVASQAQQFAWLEKDYPLLFDKIKGKVEEGQFLPIGGMWVESDQLMPSGEALVRQLLYGQRFFKSRFGAISKTFWLPDSFGYNPQIPQLARLAGCEFFFTQKMSWSQFNEYPLTSFLWQGQDKTQIACHFCPQNTYTAQASVDDVLNTWRNHKSLQASPTGLLTFGNGDGGGGPLAPMLENLRRCRAVAEQSGEIPKVHMGTSVDEFYQDLLDRTDGGKTLPTWTGELYLELHRGTATSHGSIKRHNRKTEILLHDIEFVGTLASLLGKNGKGGKGAYSYPKDALDPLWEDALLCQFHDVLPGSAIGMVYEDAEKLYAGIAEKGADLLDSALHALVPGSSSLAEFSSADSLVALDTTSQPRREIVRVPLAAARSLHDAAIQRSHDGEAYVLIQTERGLLSRARTTDEVAAQKLSARARIVGSDHVLSTDKLQVTISDQGRITSILDKELNRELILEGKTAGFVIFEDKPLNWDAWDVDAFHLETKEEVNASSVKVIEDGPLRAAVVATFHLGQSRIKATISLDAAAPSTREDALSLVRFDTEVEWHERHRFLKWEIPLNLTPTGDMATFENQFGFCQRPTHRNTTWDRAKFEVVAHRFADLSEFGYGVSLLNDCKYGHAAEGSLLRLSLLRAATLPDAEQDQGFHTFSFAVLPHRGSFAESDVPAVARSFNYPLHLRRVSSKSLASLSLALAEPFRLTGARNLVLDTVKRGEDDHFAAASIAKHEATVVCRFYEAFGGHGKGVFETSLPIEEAAVCDLLERELEPVEVVKTTDERSGRTTYSMALELRGFEVKSLKLKVAPTGKKA